MSEAAQTLDGWYCLHDFRTIDWTTWKMTPSEERQVAITKNKVATLSTVLLDKKLIL